MINLTALMNPEVLVEPFDKQNLENLFKTSIDDELKMRLYSIIFLTQTKFNNYVIGISLSSDTNFKNNDELKQLESKITAYLQELIKGLFENKKDSYNLGVVKYFLDRFFYEITTYGHLIFNYSDSYLLTPKEAGEKLNVSRQVINKYFRYGLEKIENTSNHKKVPLHAIELWNNPVLATKLQGISQLYKHRNYSLEAYLIELQEELNELEEKFSEPLEEVFGEVLNGNVDAEEKEWFFDYLKWKDLIEEIKEIEEKILENK